MLDPRNTALAKTLLFGSVKIRKGEKILIEAIDCDHGLVCELVRLAHEAGAFPFVELASLRVRRQLLMGICQTSAQLDAEICAKRMSMMDCYLGIRGSFNTFETSDVPSEKMDIYNTHFYHPVHHDIRVKKTRWCVLRFPTPSFAQMASMSTEAFERFYFDVCTLDYGKMERAMTPLVELMNRTDRVRIEGEGTELEFSIKGIPAVKCAGDRNIPDGEVYTAPVRESVNGVVTYTAPSITQGMKFENVRLVFKNGRIVEASSNLTKKLNEILDIDEGARYVGEFALGVNPFVTQPTGDILFDEKIAGSFHFTPGACYDEAPNGNNSALHWDLVCIQTPEYGGGRIYFDGVLIRQDGRFVLPELDCLNPENLK